MVVDSDSGSREIIDEMSNDLADRGLGRRRANTGAPNRSPFSKLTLGLAIAILALIVVLVFRGGNNVSKDEFKALASRIDQMERRLAFSEAFDKKISVLETQIQTLNQSLARLDGADRTLRERLDKLAQLTEKPATQPAPAKKTTAAPSSQKTSLPKSTPKYHEVAPGETLFQIATKYGVTVDELRRWNKIEQAQNLQPGQKLLISAGR